MDAADALTHREEKDRDLLGALSHLERRFDELARLLRLEASHIRNFQIDELTTMLPQKEACLDGLLESGSSYRGLLVRRWIELGMPLEALPQRLPMALEELAMREEGEGAELLLMLSHRLLAMELEVLELQEKNNTLSKRSIGWIDACLERLQRRPESTGYDRNGRRSSRGGSLIQRRA